MKKLQKQFSAGKRVDKEEEKSS
jgi:macrodomain Ter protein organizer (MatP/YcbG family)